MIDLDRHGNRKVITADGHDEATSISAHHQGVRRWCTPSGAVVREGERYEVELRLTLAMARYDGRVSWLKFRCVQFIVSEALDS